MNMTEISYPTLRLISTSEVKLLKFDPVDPIARDQASNIIQEVRNHGLSGLVDVAVRFKDIETPTSKLFYDKDDLKKVYESSDESLKQILKRTAERIKIFAEAQRNVLTDTVVEIPGGQAGHSVAPVSVAGCYAPGGRYPLPSSVLMTVVTARAAGVSKVYAASPRPAVATLCAAYIAGADGLLAVGGAQAIATMAYGIGPIEACDVIVGPGNKWVTAAKSLVSGICAIDMLAGPSEVLVIADETCDPDVVAADLLAQAEHDTEARPILITTSKTVIDEVNLHIQKRLSHLTTAVTASVAIQKGFAVLCEDINAAIEVSDVIGPEHLEIHTKDSWEVSKRCNHYGAVFIGGISAEVLGDYGAGPNHVLPTSGTARYTGGLSVFTFLRVRTWMNITSKRDAQHMIQDAVALARIEGLEGHAQAAECRLLSTSHDDDDVNIEESPNKKSKQ